MYRIALASVPFATHLVASVPAHGEYPTKPVRFIVPFPPGGLADLVSIYPWIAVFGPAGMPADIAQRLSREINAIIGRADVSDNLNKQGFVPVGSSPAELGELVRTQLEAWRRAVREAGIPQD